MKDKIYHQPNLAKSWFLALLCFLALCMQSCRDSDTVISSEPEDTGSKAEKGDVMGLYLLNQGNMGSNKATLDFLDLSGDNSENVIYHRNIYSERNPNEIKELGDVGNDIKIYGSKLWMVINCSNKVEVADAYTCKKVAKIDIPNCRYLAFDGGFAYVSAYVAPVNMRQDAEVGAVYKVDTLTMKVVDKVTVGYQPDELAVVHGKLYVANSGGYRNPNYDRTVSVIDLKTFKEERKIDVAINLHRCRADKYGQLWVSSRGDYKEVPSRLYWLKPNAAGQMEKGGELEVPVSNMCIVGDSLYYIGVQWNETSKKNSIEYGIVNVSQHKVIAHSLSSAPEIQSIEMPYGIIVNPQKKDFYLMASRSKLLGHFRDFLERGGFPKYLQTGSVSYLSSLYESIIFRDVMARNGLTNDKEIKELAFYLASNATQRVTYNSLGKIVGIRHPETIKNYLEYIQQTYMIFQLLKYAPSVKTQMLSPKKVYFIDNAIISRMGFNVTDNNGVKLENAVFIELLRRGCDLFYHADKKECDFVVREGVRITQAYQVTVKMDDEKTRKREIEGLQEAMEIYDLSEGYIITLNEKEELTVDGKTVHIIPAWEWMLK